MNKISIIMPCYNAQEFIKESIDSVLAQTCEDWELLIVDNGCTDDSMSICQDRAWRDERIKILQYTEQKGPAAARNFGIKNARGRYLAFLDSDDLWDENFLEKMLAFCTKGEKPFCCASYRVISEDGTQVLSTRNVPEKAEYTDILKTNTIGCLSAFIDMAQLGKNYMPHTGHEDCGLWLDLLKKTEYVYGLDIPLCSYRKRKSSVSGNKLKAAGFQWRLYRKQQHLSFFKSIYYFAHYAVNGILK